jgi:hypothetical protein
LHDAGDYLVAADAILGPEWVGPGQFRVGASALPGSVLAAFST